MKHGKNFYAGRTAYREADYKFARTCEGYYPAEKPNRDLIVGRAALVIFIVIAVLMYFGQV